MQITRLKKITIDKFRALNNVEIEFGDAITVICGKNGTSKSSILGISAQIFSFDKDYSVYEDISYRQITGGTFKSQYSEHFRISNQFDKPGSMEVNIALNDGYTNKIATAELKLIKRESSPRPVVRNNSSVNKGENKSRNFTHPVIFLSLKRLFPIAERDYHVIGFDYLNQNQSDFIGLTNELLNRQSSLATGTKGTISSAVAHGDFYDQESVSAGEDNAGQIILALMSFRKLKAEYKNYKGGLLLIDEADAGLFPTAQINLLKILERECRSLNLQVVMTSHSPTLIEYAYKQSQLFKRRYKTIYLSNTFGQVRVMTDWSWVKICADINTTTVNVGSGEKLPKVNIYFEDTEAKDFFSELMRRQSINKFLELNALSLGCSNYIQLINKGVKEFSERSIVCLDSDVKSVIGTKRLNTVVLLPGALPPDQLIFEYLYNLSEEDSFWINDRQFTRAVFTNSAAEVIREFGVTGNKVDLANLLIQYKSNDTNKKPREVFKRFYKELKASGFVTLTNNSPNPWKNWVKNNLEDSNKFLKEFEVALQRVLNESFALETNNSDMVKIKLLRA